MANEGNESNIPNDVILLLIFNKIPGKMILDFAGLASKKFQLNMRQNGEL